MRKLISAGLLPIPQGMMACMIACVMFLMQIPCSAQNYNSAYENLPFSASVPAQPKIPNLTVSLTDFGGKGDGITLNTSIIAKAIEHLSSKGGGHLVIPEGIWLTGPIVTHSNFESIDWLAECERCLYMAVSLCHILTFRFACEWRKRLFSFYNDN